MDLLFEPVIWPEDRVPSEAAEYQQCEICTPSSRIIWGEGNPQASVVIVLDNPGARENREGIGYVCPTRDTLQNALHKAGLQANDFYLTYLLKCRPLGKYNKEEVRNFSKPFLIRQIKAISPKILVLLGDVVVQAMFNNPDAHVKEMRGSWHSIWGYPCLISYHPLAIRRRPNLTDRFNADWEMLADYHSGISLS